MDHSPTSGFAFGPFQLVPNERRLTAGDQPLRLTPKAFDTLVLLVANSGRLLAKDELMRALWPDSFVEEVTLARNISDLRKTLAEWSPDVTYIETVPKHGYRFVGEVGRLPERAPQARERSEQVGAAVPSGDQPIGKTDSLATAAQDIASRSTTLAPHAGVRTGATKRGALLLTVGALAIVAPAAWEAWNRPPARAANAAAPTIAILPFRVTGSDAQDEYLGLGIADTLIAMLHRAEGLNVRPASAVARFDRAKQDAAGYGRALGVDAVLDGSVRRHGDRVRVAFQLIDVTDGSTKSADQYEATLADLFAAEDSIARRMSDAVAGAMGVRNPSRQSTSDTVNPEARIAYLKGRYLWNKRAQKELEAAVGLMEQAVALDPNYALAYVGLADAYLFSGQNQDIAIPKARASAERALALDPSLAQAHASLGLMAMNYDWNWAEAERQFKRAIELNPSYATAHHWYGEYLGYMGRFDEGLAEIARAQELDPLSTPISTDHAVVLMMARRWESAAEQLRKTLEMDPTHLGARRYLASAYFRLGRADEGMALIAELDASSNDHTVLMTLGSAYAELGRTREARAVLDRLNELSKTTYVWPSYLAYVQMRVGLVDEAFESLDRMCDERAVGVIGLKLSPVFDPVRNDPRFGLLLRRVGLGS